MDDSDILSAMFRCGTLGQTYSQAAYGMDTTRSAIGGIIKRMRDARPQVEAARLTDAQVKTILDRHFFGRSSAEVIAKDFAKSGKALSRYGVLYLLWWVMNDLHAAGPDQVINPGNADVIDWPQWWRRAQTSGVAA
jgi:hypothetical protein